VSVGEYVGSLASELGVRKFSCSPSGVSITGSRMFLGSKSVSCSGARGIGTDPVLTSSAFRFLGSILSFPRQF
jgi:hypothetical protein